MTRRGPPTSSDLPSAQVQPAGPRGHKRFRGPGGALGGSVQARRLGAPAPDTPEDFQAPVGLGGGGKDGEAGWRGQYLKAGALGPRLNVRTGVPVLRAVRTAFLQPSLHLHLTRPLHVPRGD